MKTQEKMDYALDTMNSLKEKTKNNKYFSPKFTDISINSEGNCAITRDWYEVYRKAAIEISRKYKMFPEKNLNRPSYGQTITDDDTISDWLNDYDGNLGQLQEDYPGLTLGEIQELMTWNTLCQQRAGAFMPTEFIHKITYVQY